MPERNISTGLWRDPRIRQLPKAARELFFYLRTAPESHALGIFHVLPVTICHDTCLAEIDLAHAFERLSTARLAIYDWPNTVVWVCQMGELVCGPGVWKSIDKLLPTLYGSPLIEAFFLHYRNPAHHRSPKIARVAIEAIEAVSPTVPEEPRQHTLFGGLDSSSPSGGSNLGQTPLLGGSNTSSSSSKGSGARARAYMGELDPPVDHGVDRAERSLWVSEVVGKVLGGVGSEVLDHDAPIGRGGKR